MAGDCRVNAVCRCVLEWESGFRARRLRQLRGRERVVIWLRAGLTFFYDVCGPHGGVFVSRGR